MKQTSVLIFKKRLLPYLFIQGFMLCGGLVMAQEEKIQVSGGFSVGGEIYDVNGIDNRRSPYSYQINGRIVFSYKDFSVPVSGSYRDAQFSYDFTFNRLGIAPTYKWVKVYLGWNTIQFSPYTMSGRALNGIGIELKPGDFVFTVIKGKIQNPLAIKDTLVDGASLIPIFDRQISGGKVGFAKNKNKLEFIFLNIKDDLTSFDLPDDYNETYGYNVLTPKENVTFGFNGGISLFKKLDLFFNTGASAFTADASDTLVLEYGDEVPPFIQNMLHINSSSRFALAGDGGVNFRMKAVRLGIKYRRVDPFYTTLATTYYNQDVEQYTFNMGTDILKRKIRIDAQLGFENNNLTQLRTNTTHRVIAQGTLNYAPSEKLYTTFSYNNFSTDTENRILLLNDTLRFISVSSQYGFTSQYNIKQTTRNLSFTFNAFYNTVRDQSEVEQIGDINILSISLGHAYQIPTLDMTIGPSVQFNQYEYSEVDQKKIGGGLRISKRLMDKKLNMSLSATYCSNTYNNQNDGNVGFYMLSGSYKIISNGTLSLHASYRDAKSLVNKSFHETRVAVRYNHNF